MGEALLLSVALQIGTEGKTHRCNGGWKINLHILLSKGMTLEWAKIGLAGQVLARRRPF